MNQPLTYHLSPTEDASHLYIQNNKLCYDEIIVRTARDCNDQHLYLCSTAEIKEGDWVWDIISERIEKVKTITKHGDAIMFSGKIIIYFRNQCEKIEFTTDPKLLYDGVLPIPEVGYIQVEDVNDIKCMFLDEFCERYNQKDNQKVDVEELSEEAFGDYYDEDADRVESLRYGFVEGFEKCQALQNAGGFSLEDMKGFGKFLRKNFYTNIGVPDKWIYDDDKVHEYLTTEQALEKYIQSLTKEQPKGDIVIEVEMECKSCGSDMTYHKMSCKGERIPQIKLTNGQPILIFK